MTMGFRQADPKAFADLKPGDSVHFEFRRGGPMDWGARVRASPGGAK